jgi:apolipoprotein D and lipocalin family protein
MGTWFVQGVKPTMFEKTCSNAVEIYSFAPEKKRGHDIDIDFKYNKAEPMTSPLKSLPQKGWVQGNDKSNSGDWKVSPFWPVKMPYLILEVDNHEYEWVVIGYPSRAYCWVMSRHPKFSEETYNMLVQRLKDKHKYDLEGLRKVPQKWTREEREKRGLTEKEIPDDCLITKK